MSGGNCAVGLLCRHLAAESIAVLWRRHTHRTPTNPSEEPHIIPLDALLKACNLDSFKSFRFLPSTEFKGDPHEFKLTSNPLRS